MGWKIYVLIRTVLAAIAVLAAAFLGNVLVVDYLPTLPASAAQVTKTLVQILTLPDRLASNLSTRFGQPSMIVLGAAALAGFAATQFVVLMQPVRRRLALQLSRERALDLATAETFVRNKHRVVRRLRLGDMRRHTVTLLGAIVYYFFIGAAAAAVAWGLIALIQVHIGTVWQLVAVALAAVLFVVIGELRSGLREKRRESNVDTLLDMFDEPRQTARVADGTV